MSDEIVANFTLNNVNLNAQYELSEGEQIDAVLKIDTQLDVQGSELIEVTKADGIATVSSKTFEFEQAIASDTWVIEHNLNKHPSVTLVDSAGTQFIAQVEYNDFNTVTVYINGETKGKAYLN